MNLSSPIRSPALCCHGCQAFPVFFSSPSRTSFCPPQSSFGILSHFCPLFFSPVSGIPCSSFRASCSMFQVPPGGVWGPLGGGCQSVTFQPFYFEPFVPFAIFTFVSLFFRPESSPILQVGCHWHSTRGKILEKRINFSFETSLTHIRWKRFAIFSDCKLMNY